MINSELKMIKFKFFFLVFLSLLTVQLHASMEKGIHFDRAIIVIFENTNYADAIGQPYFGHLAKTGAHFTNFFAVTHPSQPNYLALTSGSVHGVNHSNPIDLNVPNIVDLLESKNVSWKVYVEDYPGNCFTDRSFGLYERRHNPFISYTNIQKNPSRCSHIVNASEFNSDVRSGKLPEYVFYIPNNENSGHNTGVAYADKWYEKTFSKYVADPNFMKDTVLITTFDESGSLASNQIYVTIVGERVRTGNFPQLLNLYSLLKMIEDNWKLGDLGKEDAAAPPMPLIWK